MCTAECAEGLSAIVAQLQHTWKYRFLYCLLLVRVALNCYNVCNNVLEAEAFNHLSAKVGERAASTSSIVSCASRCASLIPGGCTCAVRACSCRIG